MVKHPRFVEPVGFQVDQAGEGWFEVFVRVLRVFVVEKAAVVEMAVAAERAVVVEMVLVELP